MNRHPGADHRGRNAEHPSDIPARGWLDILWRVVKRIGNDNVSLVAGGVALYVMLAVFPGLAALVSIYGLFASPAQLAERMQAFAMVLPPGVWEIFNRQLQGLVHQSSSSLTLTAVSGVLLALWSARSAMSALITATNIAYGEREKRGFIVQVLLSIGFTVAAIIGFMLMLLLGIAIPAILEVLGTGPLLQWVVEVMRFVLLWCVAVLGLACMPPISPSRAKS